MSPKSATKYLNYLISNYKNPLKNSEVTVTDLKQVVIDGNTYYYFKNNKDIYRVSIKINSKVAFIKNNDIINVSYKETKDYNEIISINE